MIGAVQDPSAPASANSDLARGHAVDRALFMRQGFVILRGLIPPDWLQRLRIDYELVAERHRAAHPDVWADSAQPRPFLDAPGMVDERNIGAIQLWSDERLLTVSAQLLALPDPAVTEMMLMCNPRSDRGPASWHRDVHPHDMAPLGILQDDLRENGPRYVQYNIPLYDDHVLWVVPGSHLRCNTQEENRQLALDPCAPLPGSIPVELQAGDAVAYVNYILHWGSSYSARMRRTIHGGHALFTRHDERAQHLPLLDQGSRAAWARWSVRGRRLQDLTELALRCAARADAAGYQAALDGLHPGVGDAGRLALSCYLSKVAWQARLLNCPGTAAPPPLQGIASAAHQITLNWGPSFAQRFSPSETEAIWRRFAWIDGRLRAATEQYTPGFQAGPMEFRFERPSEPITIRDFLASWR